MLIVTTDMIAGKEIVEVKGLCKGSTVRSKNVGSDIGASLKGLVGGELNSYNDMLTEARQIAVGRMAEDAASMGANGHRWHEIGNRRQLWPERRRLLLMALLW